MGARTSTPQSSAPRGQPVDSGPDPGPRPGPTTAAGATLNIGPILARTVRHFFPELNAWLDRLPDTRLRPACVYPTRFLAWWGLGLYLFQLGSRRQLDFELRDGPRVLANFNRLAEATQTSLPVHDTLDHFLGHVPLAGWERLRGQVVQRLLRMKVLDAARLLGRLDRAQGRTAASSFSLSCAAVTWCPGPGKSVPGAT